METEEHYGLLLSIHSPLEISPVDLSLHNQQEIYIENANNTILFNNLG